MRLALGVLDHDVVRGGVLEHRLVTHVLAEAAALHAAVRRLRRNGEVVVDPGDGRLEAVRQPKRPADAI